MEFIFACNDEKNDNGKLIIECKNENIHNKIFGVIRTTNIEITGIINDEIETTKFIFEGKYTFVKKCACYMDNVLIKSKFNFGNGTAYQGEYNKDFFKKGKIIFKNYQIHEGEFENESLKKGKLIFTDGRILEGEFENNFLKKGKKIFTDGQILEREFENNETLCVICLEHERKMVFGCGHCCVCEKCSPNLDKCPLCRSKGKCFKIYL